MGGQNIGEAEIFIPGEDSLSIIKISMFTNISIILFLIIIINKLNYIYRYFIYYIFKF